MSELVTGDAVVLGLRPARLPSRALAVFLDLLLAWTLYVLLSLVLLAATASLDAAAVAAVQVALFLLVLVGVPIAVETLSRGRSVGKLVCGMRVVREDGGPVRFRHALVRGAIGVVEIQLSFGVLACAASLVSARGRRVGDVFAGTLVVRERVPVAQGAPVPPPPPWLAGRFGELDLSRVPDGLWLAVRQYLMRAGQLDEAVSLSMAQRLASDVAAWTGAPVPEGVPPTAYLAGVVAERQTRESQRAFGAGAAAAPPGAPGGYAAPSEPAPGSGAATGWVTEPGDGAATTGSQAVPGAASAEIAGGQGQVPAEPPRAPASERPGTGFVPPT
ncbi:RDD family protein [Streptomyces daliensis]|uniref:RDD family protein n=1 Tax=Streptomyces daliensis TaxID=299421 RepID=A0A8T4ISC3_9ACTN|nr:RDD family protein [Streptomyces daliensis]